MWTMRPPLTHPDLLARLEGLGEPPLDRSWSEDSGEYVARLALGPEHVPDLLTILGLWLSAPEGFPPDDSAFAPVHAWRALGQLRAEECVRPLLAIMNPLDREADDWFVQDFPAVLGAIGAPALEPATAYLRDSRNRPGSRGCAADGLTEIAKRHPECAERAISALVDQMARWEDTDPFLNASVVAALVKLRVWQAADVIEEAYAARRVDAALAGSWGYVRETLDVPGLGLAPDEEEFVELDDGTAVSRSAARASAPRDAAKAHRRRARESRRRNRRRKR